MDEKRMLATPPSTSTPKQQSNSRQSFSFYKNALVSGATGDEGKLEDPRQRLFSNCLNETGDHDELSVSGSGAPKSANEDDVLVEDSMSSDVVMANKSESSLLLSVSDVQQPDKGSKSDVVEDSAVEDSVLALNNMSLDENESPVFNKQAAAELNFSYRRDRDRSRSMLSRPAAESSDSEDEQLSLIERIQKKTKQRILTDSSVSEANRTEDRSSVSQDKERDATASGQSDASDISEMKDNDGGVKRVFLEDSSVMVTESFTATSDVTASPKSKSADGSCSSVAVVSDTESPVKPRPVCKTPDFEQMNQAERENHLNKLLDLQSSVNSAALSDGGRRIQTQIDRLISLGNGGPQSTASNDAAGGGNDSVVVLNDKPQTSRDPVNPKPAVAAPQQTNKQPFKINRRDFFERNFATKAITHRLYGGKMSEERFINARQAMLTVAEKLHKVSESMPDPEAEPDLDDPDYLTVPLMHHQKQGLHWMLFREKQEVSGGILADDMGLGKTLSIISLVLADKQLHREQRLAKSDEFMELERYGERAAAQHNLVKSQATLIIAPASVIRQWEAEVKKRVRTGRLMVELYHGARRENNPSILARNDIVITTYGVVSSEVGDLVDEEEESDDDDDDPFAHLKSKKQQQAKSKPKKAAGAAVLLRVAWRRVVLDEAHQIKNPRSRQSKACCRLPAVSRWCLTGTPIHNKLTDFYALLKFLRCEPFSELKVWKMHIEEKNTTQSRARLSELVKCMLLRRTKQDTNKKTGEKLVDLQPREYKLVELEMEPLEAHVYKKMFIAVQGKVRELLSDDYKADELVQVSQGANPAELGYKDPFKPTRGANEQRAMEGDNFSKMSCVLVLLLRLRQASVHMALTAEAIDLEALRDDGDVEADIVQQMQDVSFVGEQDEKENKEEMQRRIERLFDKQHTSTKFKAMLKEVDHIVNERRDKCVIVSQWRTLLDYLDYFLDERRIHTTRIDGTVASKDRQERLEAFNRVGSGPKVMLLSLTAGGVGLNLVGGNHLFMLDLHWNPALEAQACDRIYRMGQKKTVYIHKLICKNTVEQRVLDMQNRKLDLSKEVLEGAARKNVNKLTIADMKYLFELTDKKPAVPQPAQVPGGRGGVTDIPLGRVPPPSRAAPPQQQQMSTAELRAQALTTQAQLKAQHYRVTPQPLQPRNRPVAGLHNLPPN